MDTLFCVPSFARSKRSVLFGDEVNSTIDILDDHFHDECGVFGVFGHPEASNLAYLGLYALQHRGQESAGIVSSDGTELHLHRAMGQVEEIFQPNVLAQLPGSLAIGHTRYSTAGDKALLNAQPIMIDCNKGKVALGHNGNLTNAAEWRRKLEHRGSIFQTNSDTEVIVHLIARSQARNLSGALGDALNQVEGAYSLVMLTQDELYAVRDPRGFRPLVLGKLITPGGFVSWLVASETCAFDLLNAQYVREIAPGEMVRISKSGIESIHFAPEKPLQQCIFEHVYFSRPDSIIFGRSVNQSREMLGRLLAKEHPVEADIVVPVPDSGVPAAVGYALESKIPFRMGLIRNHYIGRTFIEPSQAIRNFGVKLKLNPIRGLLEGQRVILVDDSIVRGTTSRKIVRMVRDVGAKEVHVRISCPPTISPCYYGVDTPTREELIASSNSPEEICKFLGADSLGYVSMPALRQAVADTESKFCTSCYTGLYPTDLVQLEVRESASNGKSADPIPSGENEPASAERPVVVQREN
jgi:amidophosphoribosyltransferase